MLICPNCRRQLPDGTKFCSGCGTPLQVAGSPVSAPVTPAEPVPQAEPVPAGAAEKPNASGKVGAAAGKIKDAAKKIPAKYLKIGGIVLAALLLILLVAGLFGGGSSGDYVLYIKDDQIWYNDFSKNAPYEITDDLMDDADNYTLQYYADDIGSSIHITENGKTMFYMDKTDSDDGTATLYYRSLTNLNKDPQKLSGGVSVYSVSDDGKTVTYLKGSTLYQHDLKDETKIAKNVEDYSVTGDGKILYYWDEDDTIYAWYKGDKEKVGSEIYLEYITDDGKTAYYMDEDTLYKKELGGDKEKLVSDVYNVFGLSDDGSFYYVQSVSVMLSDYFVWEEDYDYWKESMDEYGEWDLYYTLNYYDGSSGTVVAAACSYPTVSYSEDGCAILYTTYAETIEQFTMEELSTAYYESYSLTDAARKLVESAMGEDGASYIAIDGAATEVEVENVSKFKLSPDGKTIYTLCNVEDDEGELYMASVSGTKVGEFEEADDSVSSEYGMYFATGSNYFYYFKDVDGYEAELCVNGESVADDVYVYGVRYNTVKNALVFYADYNSDDGEGTLCTYNGKKTEEIADDVYSFRVGGDGKIAFLYDYNSSKAKGSLACYNGKKILEVAEDVHTYAFDSQGNVLYLYDYSTSSYRGDLARFNGKKSVEIDEDVVALITVYKSGYYGFDS